MMTRRGFVAGTTGALLSTVTGGCSYFGRSASIRYRMTVEVATPQGLRSGSSVIESTMSIRRTFTDPRAIGYEVRGEAVVVDLPGGTLFALLSNVRRGHSYQTYLLNDALQDGVATPPLSRHYKGWEWAEERAEARRVKPTIILSPKDYPAFVWFKDLRDPSSVQSIDPDKMSEVYGLEVGIQRVLITVTDDEITKGIRRRLPWLESYAEKYLDGVRASGGASLASRLNTLDFGETKL